MRDAMNMNDFIVAYIESLDMPAFFELVEDLEGRGFDGSGPNDVVSRKAAKWMKENMDREWAKMMMVEMWGEVDCLLLDFLFCGEDRKVYRYVFSGSAKIGWITFWGGDQAQICLLDFSLWLVARVKKFEGFLVDGENRCFAKKTGDFTFKKIDFYEFFNLTDWDKEGLNMKLITALYVAEADVVVEEFEEEDLPF